MNALESQSQNLFAVEVPPTGNLPSIDWIISNAFRSTFLSISMDCKIYSYRDLLRDGDSVTHVRTGQVLTVEALNCLLSGHRGVSVHDSVLRQNLVTGELEQIL